VKLISCVAGLLLAVLTAAPAQATPPLAEACGTVAVVDNVCALRLTSVTADVVNGTITGTPVGGGAPITLSGPASAYLKSSGFGATPPQPVVDWDTQIEHTSGLSTDASDPNWYANAKTITFLSRSLNGLAVEFPPNTLLVSFGPDDTGSGAFPLVSIQPTAQ
jgi:hypothetical protein